MAALQIILHIRNDSFASGKKYECIFFPNNIIVDFSHDRWSKTFPYTRIISILLQSFSYRNRWAYNTSNSFWSNFCPRSNVEADPHFFHRKKRRWDSTTMRTKRTAIIGNRKLSTGLNLTEKLARNRVGDDYRDAARLQRFKKGKETFVPVGLSGIKNGKDRKGPRKCLVRFREARIMEIWYPFLNVRDREIPLRLTTKDDRDIPDQKPVLKRRLCCIL